MCGPPRALTVAVLAALAVLLCYPLHRPYLYPDQDLPATMPLFAMALPTWVPRIVIMYGSALPSLLHVVDRALLGVGRVAGWWSDPTDLLVAWCQAPWVFRLGPRVIAMGAGVASLIAARRIVALVADGWSALAAPVILGTWLVFVREHHHGLYDAPAAGSAMLALWAATAHVRRPGLVRIATAGAFAGLATSFKYNLAPTVPAVLAASLVVPPAWRARTVATTVLAAAAAFLATTPEVVIDHDRWRAYLAAYVPLQHAVLTTAAGGGGNRLLENALHGIGWVGLGLAAAALAVTVRARERALVPLLGFVGLYATVLVTTPLALTRYILPIAGPLAVVVAFGLAGVPRRLAAVAVAVLVVLNLPACVRYVRLLAIEDTRVEAARLVEAEWERGGRVVLAANPVLGCYAAPDVAQLPRYDPPLPQSVQDAVAARAPRCVRPLETLALAPDVPPSAALRPYAGALVVTADTPAPGFARATTPPEVTAVLAREATLVADLAVERSPAPRAYEVLDLNFVPFTGLDSLVRPGPRLRLWRVPGG